MKKSLYKKISVAALCLILTSGTVACSSGPPPRRHPPPPQPMYQPAPPPPIGRIQPYDTNRDGRVTKEELLHAFKEMDKNGDGVVDEFEAGRY